MNVSRVTRQIAQDEGYRGDPYLDSAGVWTIGYGHNLDALPLTKSQCRFILKDDVKSAVEDCERFIPDFFEIDEPRQEVLVNMMFNLGWPKLKGFKKFLAAVWIGDWEKAADEMLDSKWARQVKSRAENLADTMRSGICFTVK